MDRRGGQRRGILRVAEVAAWQILPRMRERGDLLSQVPQVYYHCKDCRKQFSCKVKVGTSRIPVREWLFVMYKISVSRRDISSLQLAKELDRPQ